MASGGRKEHSESHLTDSSCHNSKIISKASANRPLPIDQELEHENKVKVKSIEFNEVGIPAFVYKEFFNLSKAGMACFEFLDPIKTDLPEDKIIDQIWFNRSTLIDANMSMAKALGFSDPTSLRNKSFSDLFPANKKNYSIIQEWIEQQFRLSKTETVGGKEAGEYHITQISLYANQKDQRIKRLWILIKDTSDTRIAAMTRIQEENYYRELMNLPNLVLLRQTPNGKLVYLTPHVEKIVGYSAKDFQKKPKLFRQILHRDDYSRYNKLVQVRKGRSTKAVEAEYRIRHSDGSYHWLKERQIPRLNNKGKVEYYDSIIFDIQEKKQLEMALSQAQCLETVGTLAEGIAHDFNNYLAAILGQLNLSLKELDLSNPCYPRLTSAEQAALRCAEMTRHLLSFGRTTDLKLKALDTTALIYETTELLRHLLPTTIDIKLEIASDLNTVKGNFTQLQQVLMNLAVNSRDAITDGGVLKVEAKNIKLGENVESTMFPQAVKGAYVEISVSDTGKGISEVCLPHIFDPFFTTKSGDQGSGLGLSMAYSIIKAHDGFIHISSKEDQGTRVVMMLPSADLPTRTIMPNHLVTSPRGDETVLVAEDDELVLAMVESALTLHGYSVITAADGQEAIDMFQSNMDQIDIALIDQTMPKHSGTEVIEQIYKLAPKVKIILTSGYGEKRINADMNEVYSRFVSKPYPVPKLLALIRELLDIE